MVDPIRIGIIGAGSVAQARHIPRLQKVPSVQITHAWSQRLETSQTAARKFGIPNVVTNWEAIVESPEIDAVVIATPPILHLPTTLTALNAGKHVLCQARMARNLKEARMMLEASNATDLVTTLYPPLAGLKGDWVMRRLLHDEGYVGTIQDVRVTDMTQTVPSAPTWRMNPEVVGVNTMSMGIMAEVFNRWVGPAKSISVSSDEPLTAVPQSLAIGATLEGGGTASFHLSSQVTHDVDSSIEIFGSRGVLHYKFSADEISGMTESEDKMHLIEISPHEHRTQTTDAEFIEAIRKGTPVAPSFEEGLKYMEFNEAVAQSLHDVKTVSMPPNPKMQTWGGLL